MYRFYYNSGRSPFGPLSGYGLRFRYTPLGPCIFIINWGSKEIHIGIRREF